MMTSTRLLRTLYLLPLGTALALLAGGPGTAHAHIDVDNAGSHMSRSPGSSLKEAPCGMAGSQRGTNVYTYRPGATINISLNESVPHPSYFRISFDDDGDDDFVIPSGTAGEFGDCGGNAACGPGKEDYCSNETVLLDHLDPHPAGALNQQYTWSVTLPNIECDNCTIQLIQMMNDFAPFHTPADYPANDIYYHCIDIVLSKDAPETNDTPVENNGIVCERPADPEPVDMGDGMPVEGPGQMAPPDMTDMMDMTDMTGSTGMMDMGTAQPPMNTTPPTPVDTATPAPMDTMGTPVPANTSGTTGTDMPMDTAGAPGSVAPATPAVGMMTAAVGAAPASTTPTSSDDGGCRIASSAPPGLWAPIALALLALARRRF